MSAIKLDRDEPVYLATEWEPQKFFFVVDIRNQVELARFPYPEGYSDSGATILHKLRIILLRGENGDRLCAVNYSGQLLWTRVWHDGDRDPICELTVESEEQRVWVGQLLTVTALEPSQGSPGLSIKGEAVHFTSDGQLFVVRGAALFRNTGPGIDNANFKRCAKLVDDGMTTVESGGGKLLLNSIKRACLVDTLSHGVTKVAHGMVGHWQRPHYVESMKAFVTVGFVNSAIGFIMIAINGKVRLGPLSKDGLVVGIVRFGSGSFALMQTGKLIELSDAMFESE